MKLKAKRARMPYKKMYMALQRKQGRQLFLCERALQKGVALYDMILKSEQGNVYSEERESINIILVVLSDLRTSMIDADIAVEAAILERF